MARSIAVYKLTPAQIALAERLAGSENGIEMDALEYREVVAYQELARLKLADMAVVRRLKIRIVLTELGRKVRANGYFSEKAVLQLTGPQINALRFLAGGRRRQNEIPSTMLDVCRRLYLRGWVSWEEDIGGERWARITTEGWQILKLADL